METEIYPRTLYREKVEKRVAQRVDAGFVTDVIVIFRPKYRKSEERILTALEPEARTEKIQVLEAAVMKSLDIVAGALLRRGARLSVPGVPVSIETPRSRLSPDRDSGSGKLVSSWLSNSVSFLASPAWIKRLAANKRVCRILTNKTERLPEPFHSASGRAAAASGDTPWGIERLDIPALWKQGLYGKGVRVGHLDTGVDPTHPALKGRVVEWEAFDQFGQSLTGTPRHDTGFHGTHTAAIIAGGSGVGVAPKAELVSALVLPQGTGATKQVLTGVEWCLRQGVKVLNLSLGGSGYNEAYEPALRNLGLFGVFPSFSVGNSGLGVTGSPANLRQACAVGAVNSRLQVADFSGGGAFLWGENDLYVKPDLCAPGVEIRSAIPRAYVRETGEEPYDLLDGTSTAAPHVAGVAALLWGAFPDASIGRIREALYTTCLPLGPAFHNMHSGRGLIQPAEALRKLDALAGGSRRRPRKRPSVLSLNREETIATPGSRTAKAAGSRPGAKKS